MGQRVEMLQSQLQDAAHWASPFSRRDKDDRGMPVLFSISRSEKPSARRTSSASSEPPETISLVVHWPSANRASNGSASPPQNPRDLVKRTSNRAPSLGV